jgi:hypothetical protein
MNSPKVSSISALHLEARLVFLDVNGTLLPSDSRDGHVPDSDVALLRAGVATVRQRGWQVGLCSDSPVEQLRAFGRRVGLGEDIPIIAENGNCIAYGDRLVVLRSLAVGQLKSRVVAIAHGLGMPVPEGDVVAPEFGGPVIRSRGSIWAFGANRITSLTVFGPRRLIGRLGEVIAARPDRGVDCSPDAGYFALHPDGDFRRGKHVTLSQLAAQGHEVVMIGDSLSDLSPPESGVRCALVSGNQVPRERPTWYRAGRPLIGGVVQALSEVAGLHVGSSQRHLGSGSGRPGFTGPSGPAR